MFLTFCIIITSFMCLPKRREKTKQNKQTLNKLIKSRKDLPNKDIYPRFFLQILLFMEQSIKQQIRSPVPSICSCSNIPDVYVRQRFHQAYQDCSTDEKLNYLMLTHHIISNPPKIEMIQNIQRKFTICVRNFIPWTTRQTAKLIGFRFVTQDYQLDLRRYIVRESRSAISRSYVLEAICEIKPQKLRFSFEDDPDVEDDISAFLEAAKIGFMYTAQNWAKKMDHVEVKKPSIIKKIKNEDQDMMKENRWSQIFQKGGQSQDGEQKVDKKPQVKKYKFTEESSQEDQNQKQKMREKKSRKVKTEVSQSPPQNIFTQKNESPFKKVMQTTATTLTVPSMKEDIMKKKRKPSIALLTYQPMARNEKNILKNLIPHYDIRQMESLQKFALTSKKNEEEDITKVYENIEKTEIKGKVRMKQFTPQLVVLGLLDFIHYKQWNYIVQQAQIHMKLESQNCFISSIKFKGIDKSFTLMVHLCEFHNEFYIAFKSLEDSSEKSQFVTNAIFKVSQQKNHTYICYHFFYKYNPDLAINFMRSIEQLSTYLQTKLGKQSLKQYLKFGRLIDKEVNNESVIEFDRRSHEYSYGQEQFGNVSQLQRVKNIQSSFFSVGSFSELYE